MLDDKDEFTNIVPWPVVIKEGLQEDPVGTSFFLLFSIVFILLLVGSITWVGFHCWVLNCK